MALLLFRRFKGKGKNKTSTCPHRLEASAEAPQGSAALGKPEPDHLLQKNIAETASGNVLGQANTSAVGLDSKGRCVICRKEQLAARSYRLKLIVGLFFPFALQALDVTIIASALPWIASDFNKISEMNWIISAFNLTSAAFIPFWGQVADIFGRHVAVESSLFLMMIGSALCTAAPYHAFPMLIFGRAFQGMACAGINVLTRVILADNVSLKEYSKNFSIFSIVAGISYAIGPVIGGYLTDKSWRWCFGVNLPVAVAGVLLVFFVLRHQLLGPQSLPEPTTESEGPTNTNTTQRLKARISTIDFGGQFLFLSGMSLLILALTWGGATYKWNSPQVLVSLILGTMLAISFILWQYMMAPGRFLARKYPFQRPTIPWLLVLQRNMGLLFYINFATGMAMIAVLYFVDIYFTLVKAYTPSNAGVQLLYYTPGIGVGVYLSMYMCNIYPRQTFHPLFLGSIIEALGVTILAWALHKGHTPTIYGMMGLTGAGTGLRFMPGSLHGIGFFPNNIASVLSMMAFALPLGGTLAMTIMDTVFNNRSSLSISSARSGGNQISAISALPPDVQKGIRDGARDGVVWAFVAIAPFMWLCVLSAACLGNVRVTAGRKVDGVSGRVDMSGDVAEKSYLGSFFARRVRAKTGTKEGGGQEVQAVEEKQPAVNVAMAVNKGDESGTLV